MKISKIISLFLILTLLSPFIILISKSSNFIFPDIDDLTWALKNTIYQSALSSVLSILFSLFLTMGLLKFQKYRKLISFFCMLPAFLPSMVSILILFNLINPFPVGLAGIVVVHSVIFCGFAAVLLVDLIEEKALSLIESSYVLGLNKNKIFFQVLNMLKKDIFSIFIFIFSICFLSFSVPVAVGGGTGTTLEVLIYEKLRITGDWNQALSLAIVQTVILFLFSLFYKKSSQKLSDRAHRSDFVSNYLGVALLFIYTGVFMYGLLKYSLVGFLKIIELPEYLSAVKETLPMSVIFVFTCSVLTYFFLLFCAFSLFEKRLKKFLLGFFSPSMAIVGVAVIFLKIENDIINFMFYILAFIVLNLASLYRMGFESHMTSLSNQIKNSQILGASELQTFTKIIFPQVHWIAAQTAGIAGLWIAGDFALSKIIFSHDVTLAQIAESMMNSYRFDKAAGVMLIFLSIGLVNYLFFLKVSNVYRQKS